MKILALLARVFIEEDELESTILFYEGIFRVKCKMRFKYPEVDLELAQVGSVLLIAGTKKARQPFQNTKAACEPLLSNTPITHFEYDRYYKKGSVFSLVTEQQHARWFTDYVGQNSLVNTAEHAITNIHKGLRHGLWSSYVPDLMSHMDGFLDVKEPISLLNDCGDYYEVNSFFASSQIENHRILDFYFSNIAFLRKFVIYFRESAANIINNGDKTYNRFPVETLPIYQPSSASSSTETINILPTIKITSYPLQNALNKQIPPPRTRVPFAPAKR